MVIGSKRVATQTKGLAELGMPRPEGYRKALRLMELAAKFPGRSSRWWIRRAYPGIDARTWTGEPSPLTFAKCPAGGAGDRG